MSVGSLSLYVDDSKLREFDAVVARSGPRYVLLDRTAFYPEGGGQPCDTGTLTVGGRAVRVLRVQKRGSEIYHYLDADIPTGSTVHGSVDWASRWWNTRRHSAEHLLTGLIEELGEPPKVFSSLERLEYQSSGLTEERVRLVRERFNDVVEADLPVRVYYEDRASLDASNDQRKQTFLEKIPKSVTRLRMVDIAERALTFCMGTHVASTGEIGRLKELRLEDAKKERKILHFSLHP